MKHLFFAAMILIAACGGPSSTPMTIEQIAEAHIINVGEIGKIYRCDTKNTMMDGSYVGINFQSITRHHNNIVIKNVSDMPQCEKFVKDIAFFILIDEFNNETSDYTASVRSSDMCEIVISYNTDISKYKYIKVGTFDLSLYSSNMLVFEIQQ